MAEPPPRDPLDPREPVEPAEDETVIVPPAEETVVQDEWGPESEVFVEQTEDVPPRRPLPQIWPGLLALLVLVVGGLAAAYFLTRDDGKDTTPTTTAATTTAATTTAAQQVAVPDVVGTTSSEATATLRDAGFTVNLVAVPSDSPSGQVVAQDPVAGGDAPEGSAVRINVAEKRPSPPAATTGSTTTGATTRDSTTTAATTGGTTTAAAPQPATVPDVVGQELAEAARAFGDQGLKASVQYVPSQEAAGRVVAQAQPPGTERKRGDTVQLNVSIGPEPSEPAPRASVPDVVGQQLDQGRRALVGAGFEVLALNLQGDPIRNESAVASQTPAGAASIPRGSLVLLYVGT